MIIASGKTINYFYPKVKNWNGRVLAVTFNFDNKKGEELKKAGFRRINLESPDVSFDGIFESQKIILDIS